MTGWDETPPPSWQEIAEGMATKLAAAKEEIEQLRADGQSWEYFAFLAFVYHDARDGSTEVGDAWWELKAAIEHWRAVGGREPRDVDVWVTPIDEMPTRR